MWHGAHETGRFPFNDVLQFGTMLASWAAAASRGAGGCSFFFIPTHFLAMIISAPVGKDRKPGRKKGKEGELLPGD